MLEIIEISRRTSDVCRYEPLHYQISVLSFDQDYLLCVCCVGIFMDCRILIPVCFRRVSITNQTQ